MSIVHIACHSVETVTTHVMAVGTRRTQAVSFAHPQQEALLEQLQSQEVTGIVAFAVLVTTKLIPQIVFYVALHFQDA